MGFMHTNVGKVETFFRDKGTDFYRTNLFLIEKTRWFKAQATFSSFLGFFGFTAMSTDQGGGLDPSWATNSGKEGQDFV
jgi:hypothetical protein